jgi:hypothetical protein
MLWGSSPVHLLLEEFGKKKKKTNIVDPAARAGVKNVIYFISGGVKFCYVPKMTTTRRNILPNLDTRKI